MPGVPRAGFRHRRLGRYRHAGTRGGTSRRGGEDCDTPCRRPRCGGGPPDRPRRAAPARCARVGRRGQADRPWDRARARARRRGCSGATTVLRSRAGGRNATWDRRADVFSLAVLVHEWLWAKRVTALGRQAADALTALPGADLPGLQHLFYACACGQAGGSLRYRAPIRGGVETRPGSNLTCHVSRRTPQAPDRASPSAARISGIGNAGRNRESAGYR